MLVGGHGVVPVMFESPHLFGMVVVIRQRPIDVRNRNLVAIGHCPGREAPILDLRFDELDRDATPLQMWLIVQFLDDGPCHLAHTITNGRPVLERPGQE